MRPLTAAVLLFAAFMVALWLSSCRSAPVTSPSRLDQLRAARISILESRYLTRDAEKRRQTRIAQNRDLRPSGASQTYKNHNQWK